MVIRESDTQLYEWISDHIESVQEHDLKQILTKWKSENKEIENSVIFKHDSYTVKWTSKNGDCNKRCFSCPDNYYPEEEARVFFNQKVVDSSVVCVELFRNRNRYANVNHDTMLDCIVRMT